MSFDQLLTERVRKILAAENVSESVFPNGIGFLSNEILVCGIFDENLILQVGEDRYEEILTHPLARPMDMYGQSTVGWVGIIPTGTKRDVDLAGWIKTGLDFAQTLPHKE